MTTAVPSTVAHTGVLTASSGSGGGPDPDIGGLTGLVLQDGEEFCTALAGELERMPGLGLPGTPGVAVVPSGLGRDAVSRGAVARSLATARAERLGLGAGQHAGVA